MQVFRVFVFLFLARLCKSNFANSLFWKTWLTGQQIANIYKSTAVADPEEVFRSATHTHKKKKKKKRIKERRGLESCNVQQDTAGFQVCSICTSCQVMIQLNDTN